MEAEAAQNSRVCAFVCSLGQPLHSAVHMQGQSITIFDAFEHICEGWCNERRYMNIRYSVHILYKLSGAWNRSQIGNVLRECLCDSLMIEL